MKLNVGILLELIKGNLFYAFILIYLLSNFDIKQWFADVRDVNGIVNSLNEVR